VTVGSEPTDEAIREMLQARASLGGQAGFDASVVAAEAIRRARARPRPMPLMPRLALAMTSLAAVIVVAVLVARPLGNGPASAPPTGAPSSDSANGTPSPTPFATPRLLSPAEVGVLVRTRAAELGGTIVAVRGRLETDPSVRCRAFACATVLADSGGGFFVRPVGDIGPGPWDGSGPKDGVFALRITPSLTAGQPGVEYIGDLVNRDDGTFVVSVADIVAGAVRIEGAYAAVDGWLVRTPFHPCGSDPHPPPGPAYGCPTDDWLTETADPPPRSNGQSLGPPNAIYLPTGAYDQWAPDPAHFGRDIVGVEPRRATYLLQVVQASACGPNADCFVAPGNLRWQIVGRFDPIPNLESPNNPEASALMPSVVPPVSGTAWTVAELAAQHPSGSSEYLVRGYLVASPALRCIWRPVPSGLPDYGCGEVDWLTDEPFQPWVVRGNGDSIRSPSVGIRVQNGAYELFAPDPAISPGGGMEPRLGTYLVRFAIHSACEYAHQSSDLACYGGLIFTREIVGRLP